MILRERFFVLTGPVVQDPSASTWMRKTQHSTTTCAARELDPPSFQFPTNRTRLRGFSSPSSHFCWGTKKAPGFSWRVSTLNFAWGVPIIFKLRRICVEKASLIFSFFARRSRLESFRYFRNSILKKMHCALQTLFRKDVDFFTC